MISRRSVGRPAMWHKPILEYVEEHGEVRALEIRIELGVPKRTLYDALKVLVATGNLAWKKAGARTNYRVLYKVQTLPRLDVILCHPHL